MDMKSAAHYSDIIVVPGKVLLLYNRFPKKHLRSPRIAIISDPKIIKKSCSTQRSIKF